MNETRRIPIFVVYSKDDEYHEAYHSEVKALKKACEICFEKFEECELEHFEEINGIFKTAKDYFDNNDFQKCYEHLNDFEDECPEIIEMELVE